jgi:hypothetical protein
VGCYPLLFFEEFLLRLEIRREEESSSPSLEMVLNIVCLGEENILEELTPLI